MGLASWESLLSFLKQHLENSNDYQGAQEVWQLKGLCERLDYDAFHPLQEGDFTSISERQIKDLKSLLDDVVTVLVGQEVANIKRYKTTPGPDYYKRYMTLQGHRNWCAEYNAFYWNHFHLTPLWLTTTATPELLEALDPLRQGPTEKLFRYGRQLVIPLELPLQVERQEVIDSLVSQIEKIATLIKMNQ
jgi:hypothetical protein